MMHLWTKTGRFWRVSRNPVEQTKCGEALDIRSESNWFGSTTKLDASWRRVAMTTHTDIFMMTVFR